MYVHNGRSPNLSHSTPCFITHPNTSSQSYDIKAISSLIAVVYRRPNAACPIHFFETLSSALATYKDIIITGDFNADLIQSEQKKNHSISPIFHNQHILS